MMRRLLLPLAALLLATSAFAQTKIDFSDVRALDRNDSLHGTDATIQLNKAEGSDNAVLMTAGDVIVKVTAKVTTHKSPRSSLKDSAVNLDLDITMKAGKEKDTKHVEKIFYMDQKRRGTVTQRFNFKNGINMRTITLTFNVSIE